jgi:hypothetical protein
MFVDGLGGGYRREHPLFPDCSLDRNRSVGNSEPNRGRIGTGAKALEAKKSKAQEFEKNESQVGRQQ